MGRVRESQGVRLSLLSAGQPGRLQGTWGTARETPRHRQAPTAPTPQDGTPPRCSPGRAGRREQQTPARKIDYMLYWI